MDSEHPPDMTHSRVRSPPLASVTPGPLPQTATAPAVSVLLPALMCPEGLGPLQRDNLSFETRPPPGGASYGPTRWMPGIPRTGPRVSRGSPFSRPDSAQGTAGRESARSRASTWVRPNVCGRMDATRVTSCSAPRSAPIAADFDSAASCVRFAPTKAASSGTSIPPVSPWTALRHSSRDRRPGLRAVPPIPLSPRDTLSSLVSPPETPWPGSCATCDIRPSLRTIRTSLPPFQPPW